MTEQGSAPLLAFGTEPEARVRAPGQEKAVKGMRIGKEEMQLFLFADDIIVYIENSKGATKTPLRLVSKLIKVTRYKINTCNGLYLHILAITMETPKLKSQYHLQTPRKT